MTKPSSNNANIRKLADLGHVVGIKSAGYYILLSCSCRWRRKVDRRHKLGRSVSVLLMGHLNEARVVDAKRVAAQARSRSFQTEWGDAFFKAQGDLP